MVIHKMVGEECNKTRSLWEEVFWEDSIQFTDYYFKHKAKLNTGYVIGEYPYNAMLFRTPYMLQIGEVKKMSPQACVLIMKRFFGSQAPG